MKKLFYIGLLLSLYSCSLGPRFYSYKFSMQESEKPRKLKYENDTVLIDFKFHNYGSELMMEFSNKSDWVIKFDWEKLKMRQEDSVRKIMHLHASDEVDFIQLEPPKSIAPRQTFSDLIVFTDNVFFSKDGNAMKIKPMYPKSTSNRERKYVEQLVGRRIQLSFPMEINNAIQELTFNFKLDKIKSIRAVDGLGF